jgi:hypothetical protein
LGKKYEKGKNEKREKKGKKEEKGGNLKKQDYFFPQIENSNIWGMLILDELKNIR